MSRGMLQDGVDRPADGSIELFLEAFFAAVQLGSTFEALKSCQPLVIVAVDSILQYNGILELVQSSMARIVVVVLPALTNNWHYVTCCLVGGTDATA